MFGSRERKLRKHGRAALATVLSARRQRWAPALVPDADVNPSAALQPSRNLWKMTVRVEPPGEPPFDANVTAWLPAFKAREGSIVSVLYDPSDHRKVVLDRSLGAQRAASLDPRNVRVDMRRHEEFLARLGGLGEVPVVSAADLLAAGQRVAGVLKSFADTGTTPRSLGRTPSRPEFIDAPRYMLVVDLQFPNLAPVEGRNTQVVPRAQVPNLAIGLKLPCVVDPADPGRLFVVDWDALAH